LWHRVNLLVEASWHILCKFNFMVLWLCWWKGFCIFIWKECCMLFEFFWEDDLLL
jgi:hypothetical protein